MAHLMDNSLRVGEQVFKVGQEDCQSVVLLESSAVRKKTRTVESQAANPFL